jgi:ribulose-5-phosphate 4-epimerase/fuculose-1-phosphate aldolase
MRVTHSRTESSLPAGVQADSRIARLCGWGARLAELGLSPGESGNMSFRVDEGFLVSRTTAPLAELGPDDWVLVTGVDRLDKGGLVVNSIGEHDPSRDSAVHAAVYGAKPDAEAVFHFHVGNLEVLTRLDVPATKQWHSAGTTESMEEIERFLTTNPDTRYFVLVEHGTVAVGDSVDEAGALVEQHHHMVVRALAE